MSPTLYDADFNQWLEETANSLKSRNFQALDLESLIEEIESMGRSDKREIKTRLIVLLMHLIKQKYQSQRQTTSWIVTINEQRRQIKAVLKDSPSLKPYLQKELGDCYEDARKDAAQETGLPVATFPLECPFTQAQILDSDYFPNA